MIKEFLNPGKEIIRIQDKDGEVHELELKILTADDMDDINRISLELGDKQNESPAATIKKQLALMFGKDEKFYGRFSIIVLTQLMSYITEIMRNPSKTK